MTDPIRIGRLRWRVQLINRLQTPDPASAGIVETATDAEFMFADIQPIGAMTFYGAVNAQGDTAPTHKVTTRWLDAIDTRHAFLRTTTRPDGTIRNEVFRVRRVTEDYDGRKRFTVAECQLETLQ